MAGKDCYPRIRESRSYCEGMAYRAGGTEITRPVTGNPHPVFSKDSDAWIAGWGKAEASSGGTLDASEAGCCGLVGVVVAAAP